ncbi:hypothetical protein M8J76_011054 [Diaphorina citri]|nr:hypothetical protein M8J75_002442 [Diaphorina citri]KAI5719499.1 hypothetical protein M8J76_011054 [Diaphorina citri]KAI5721552.1 hypothetical protein M8J77_022242 [Diaphorina citri]
MDDKRKSSRNGDSKKSQQSVVSTNRQQSGYSNNPGDDARNLGPNNSSTISTAHSGKPLHVEDTGTDSRSDTTDSNIITTSGGSSSGSDSANTMFSGIEANPSSEGNISDNKKMPWCSCCGNLWWVCNCSNCTGQSESTTSNSTYSSRPSPQGDANNGMTANNAKELQDNRETSNIPESSRRYSQRRGTCNEPCTLRNQGDANIGMNTNNTEKLQDTSPCLSELDDNNCPNQSSFLTDIWSNTLNVILPCDDNDTQAGSSSNAPSPRSPMSHRSITIIQPKKPRDRSSCTSNMTRPTNVTLNPTFVFIRNAKVYMDNRRGRSSSSESRAAKRGRSGSSGSRAAASVENLRAEKPDCTKPDYTKKPKLAQTCEPCISSSSSGDDKPPKKQQPPKSKRKKSKSDSEDDAISSCLYSCAKKICERKRSSESTPSPCREEKKKTKKC